MTFPDTQRLWCGLFGFVFWSVIFGLAYTQATLYFSNQNQYFLHGLAQAGVGYLSDDWLANTVDPTPVFSRVVAWTASYLHEGFFYLYYLLLLGIYFWSLLGLFNFLTNDRASSTARMLFVTGLVAIHAAIFRWLSVVGLGTDYPWYFQAGVAGQYVLGSGLQPSVSGVFLLASITLFLRGKPFTAVALACLTVFFHPTYLLCAGFLIVAYVYAAACPQAGRRETNAEYGGRDVESTPQGADAARLFLASGPLPLAIGAFALLLVSPVVIYSYVRFAPTTPEDFAQAQYLLVHFRIPHHALPSRWFDLHAALQILWILTSFWLVRGTRLLPILRLVFLLSLGVTLVQMATGFNTLALLFPWRASAILVPMATTIFLTRCTVPVGNWIDPWPARRQLAQLACVGLLAVVVAGGITMMACGLSRQPNPVELPLLDYVRANKRRGDVYLFPVNIPDLASGSAGNEPRDFAEPPHHEVRQRIPTSFQRFRLYTGAPIYVDFKAIPYKDTEVLEWYERLKWAQQLFDQQAWTRLTDPERTRGKEITHIITKNDCDLAGLGLKKLHEDENYRLWQVPLQADRTNSYQDK